ncbi:MAG: hypothetical protein ACRC30_03350 [Clostridium sp.]
MFRRKIILIKENEIILGREKITYEKLCKVMKVKEKIDVVILNKNMIVKELETKNINKVYEFIENELLKYSNEYLIHFEKVGGENKFVIYAIKTNETIEQITKEFINSRIIPIEIYIKNILKREGNYKVSFMDKTYNIRISKNIVYMNTDQEKVEEKKLIITRKRGSVN